MRKLSEIEAYNQRDVMGISPPCTWTVTEENIQRRHNRILQPGFMHRAASSVLADAKTVGVEWLTDVCCPSVSATVMLHISKEMVVNFQVSDTALNTTAHVVHQQFSSRYRISEIEKKINQQMKAFAKDKQHINQAAREMLAGTEITPEKLQAAKRLVLDMKRREVSNRIVREAVKDYLASNASKFDLEKKTRHPRGTTHDFCFLGAAGSGKSTIARQYVSDGHEIGSDAVEKKTNQNDCVILATDNYRAFTLPGTEAHEALETKNVFVRTQDFAYLVKTLVQDELEYMARYQKRPNVICDCMQLEPFMRRLLKEVDPEKGGMLTSLIAAYRGDPGYVGIAERADKRAKNEHAAPADKGRFVETTTLFQGHARASKYLLSNIPDDAVTEVFDTNIDLARGETPLKIAVLDTKSHHVDVLDLRIMSEFLNKKRMNIAAKHPVELILSQAPGAEKTRITDPKNKARAILDLVTEAPGYSVTLHDSKGEAYASLESSEVAGGVVLSIHNARVFEEKISRQNSPEAQVLCEVRQQTVPASPTGAEERKILSDLRSQSNKSKNDQSEEMSDPSTLRGHTPDVK